MPGNFCRLNHLWQAEHLESLTKKQNPASANLAAVSQGSVLDLLYTADIPVVSNTTMAIFADDTAILFHHCLRFSYSRKFLYNKKCIRMRNIRIGNR